MSIATEITRLQTAKSDIKSAIEAKGVTVPSSAKIDTYNYYVSQISGGGGGCEGFIGMIERSAASITIPNGTTSIGRDAFYYYTGLTSVVIPSSVTSIGSSAFNGCKSLTSINIPSGVTTIYDSAFNGAGLRSITIPDSVTSIGQYCFYNSTYLTSATIGSGVTSIGIAAFAWCTSLTSITINAITPPTLGGTAFNNTNNCPIYVPAESVGDYQDEWSDYASRIQAIPNS